MNLKKLLCRHNVQIFLTILFISISLGLSAQQQEIKISCQNESIRNILKKVTVQTGYNFVYNDALNGLDEKIDFTYQTKSIQMNQLLNTLFEGKPIAYIIKNKQIVLTQKSVEKAKTATTINGIITDNEGETLPGVSVVNQTTGSSVFSDLDGKFSINGSVGDNFIFTFIGMADLDLKIGNATKDLRIAMNPDKILLDEVVVTGYQTISKERATGSFDIISKEQLQKPTTNIASRLVGTTSGVQATLNENGDPTFEIRGKSSLNANAEPLIVVDGFAIQGNFASINPNDVESITILKDAAAASIWGARSANGVIVVTTKSGRDVVKGKVRVDVSSFIKFSPKSDLEYLLNMGSSAESIDYDKRSYAKWGSSGVSDGDIYLGLSGSPAKVALNENKLGYLSDEEMAQLHTRYAKLNNREQIKEHILANPFTHQHNINIASSSDKTTNNISLLYEGRQKYLKGNSDQRVMINYRNTTKVFKWLDFNFSGMFGYTQAENNSEGIGIYKSLAPYEMLLDEAGNKTSIAKYYMPNMTRYIPMDRFPYTDWSYNPITETENTLKRTDLLQSRFQGGLTFKIIEGLTINTNAQYELSNYSYKDVYGEETFFVRNKVNTYTHWNKKDNTFTLNMPKGGMLDQAKDQTNAFIFRGQANLNRTFGKHTVSAVAGMEMSRTVMQEFKYPRTYGYDDSKLSVAPLPNGVGSNTNPNLAIYNWMGTKTTIYEKVNNTFTHKTDKYVSMYINASYTYNNKYTLSASARTDASNLITNDPAYRYSPFWSVGGSWQLAKESFMKSSESWLDILSLRVTFGYNGNVDRSTSFLPLINMSAANNLNTLEPTASISSYGNPSLRWEKTGTLDIGVDYSFFKGKLFGKLDFYNKSAKDLIASVSIPAFNGTTSQKMNVGSMYNRGFEFEIGTRLPIFKNKISFYGNYNVSYNSNKVTRLYRSQFYQSDLLPWQDGYSTVYVEGMNANTIFGCQYAGLHNDGTQSKPNMQPKVIGKDGTLYGLGAWAVGDVWNLAYNQGVSVAPWAMGLSFGFKIYDFDLSCIFTGKFGHVFRRTSYNYNGSIPNAQYSSVINGNPDEIMPLPQNDSETRYYFWDRYWKTFTYLTESASHIRMQELNLTYNMPQRLLGKSGFSQVQIYGQANNLFSIYANKYNEDPEYPLGSYKLDPGFTFGVRIGF